MKITKENKGMIIYVTSFLLVAYNSCLMLALLALFMMHTPCEGRMCGLLHIAIILLFSYILKIIIPIWGSIYIIKKSDNKKLLSIYNNFKTPAIILSCLIGLDCIMFILINVLFGYDINQYVLLFGLTPVFIIIYIIAIINTIRLKRLENNNIV